MIESSSERLQQVPEHIKIKVENMATNIVKSIKELFEQHRVGDLNENINTYINTYFSLWYILDVGKEYLFQCLNDKMMLAWLYLKKPENFDEFVEWSGLNGWEVCILWKSLKNLFQWYFSLIDDLEWIEKMGDIAKFTWNFDNYKKDLDKILEFSKSQAIERTAWRKSGEKVEYCGAYLRNLLSPFKNLIATLEALSVPDNQAKKTKTSKKEIMFNNLVKNLPSLYANKEEISKFCGSLNWNIKQE